MFISIGLMNLVACQQTFSFFGDEGGLHKYWALLGWAVDIFGSRGSMLDVYGEPHVWKHPRSFSSSGMFRLGVFLQHGRHQLKFRKRTPQLGQLHYPCSILNAHPGKWLVDQNCLLC